MYFIQLCTVYTPSKKKQEVLGKCFAPLKVGHVLAPVV